MAKQSFESKLKGVKGVLLDISGVLKDGDAAIPGSVEAVNRLLNSGLQIRLCTNETSCTRTSLVDCLSKLGFAIEEEKVFSPVPAMCQILKERNLRPHLLIDPDVLLDFKGIDQSNPNCVVVGDATHQFSYENMTTAFRCLMEMEDPVLFGLGRGKYYNDPKGLFLDVGVFTHALEYATGVKGEVVGKPSQAFFNTVLHDMGISASEAVMVGDDIIGDVEGSQACGMLGVQVRTGKYRPHDEPHPTVIPDAYVDNLAAFTNILLQNIAK